MGNRVPESILPTPDVVEDDDAEPPGRARYPHAILPPPEPTPVPLTQTADASHCARTAAFRRRFFPGASVAQWNDWRWQLQNRIRSVDSVRQILELCPSELAGLTARDAGLPVSVTPYYMSLLDPKDPNHPLRRCMIPRDDEWTTCAGEAADPLGEDGHSPVPGLVHRYPDRVLLLATDFCPAYCRYCTRSRMVGKGRVNPTKERLEQALDYIRNTSTVRDVLISGGEPLTLGDEKLDWLLGSLRRIPHVEIIRLGAKTPVVLPQRITPNLVRTLRKAHPLWMSLHFTHPEECTPEVQRACAMLADAGIPLGSQTVLLKGVNDDVATMTSLMHRLMLMRVRPYYIYQCDPISGSSHFRSPVSKGVEIIEGLRGHTSGYAVPNFVIDAPGGGGKIPIMPEYVLGREGNDLLLRNYEGRTYRYPDPDGARSDTPCRSI